MVMYKQLITYLSMMCILQARGTTTTNYVNSGAVDPDTLTGSYHGTTNNHAVNVSNISELKVENAQIDGGVGQRVTSVADIEANGYSGLHISNVESVNISNGLSSAQSIKGGKGGYLTLAMEGGRAGHASGGHAVSFVATGLSQELHLISGHIIGGQGGTATGQPANSLIVSGGSGIYADNGSLRLLDAHIEGGEGGDATAPGGITLNDTMLAANGGHGVDVNFSQVDIKALSGGVSLVGGSGGTSLVTSAGESDIHSNGGNGLNSRWNVGAVSGEKPLVIDGGIYQGGRGGVASNGTISTASGGTGLFMSGGQSVVISNGIFSGGAGGAAVSSAGGTAVANGGDGAYIFAAVSAFGGSASVAISGGIFNGGLAGTTNGVTANEGYGLVLESSDAVLSGSTTVNGRGLLANAGPVANNTSIQGGTYSSATFTSLENPLYSGLGVNASTFEILGGTIGSITLSGGIGHEGRILGGSVGNVIFKGSGENNLRLGGAAVVGDIELGGTGTNTLWITNSVVSSGKVELTGGRSNIEVWDDAHFRRTTVSDGVMNFNNQAFNLAEGSMMALQSPDARVNFNGGPTTIRRDAMLDVGRGQVSATDFRTEPDSRIRTAFADDGSGGALPLTGVIQSDVLNFGPGTSWTLYNDGTFTNFEGLVAANGFLLAKASSLGKITSHLEREDIFIDGGVWLLGIRGVGIVTNGAMEELYARYGLLTLVQATQAEGEFGKAMEELNFIVETDTDLQNYLIRLPSNEAVAAMKQTFVRTPEMANAMIGMQSVIADQIGARTRSHLRLKQFGRRSVVAAPQGAAGPEGWFDSSMEWLHEKLPSWDARDAMRTAGERLPKVKPFEVPTTYQVWGKGYGAQLDQRAEEDHAGYDAFIRGGLIGVDKHFNQALLGVAGGLAETTMEGGAGQDGEVSTLHATAYFSAHSERLYLDANISYGFNSVETEGLETTGYTGDYDANTLGFFLGAGMGISGFDDTLLFTPEVSLLSSLYTRDGYTEKSSVSSFPDLTYEDYEQWSHKAEIGASLSMLKLIDNYGLKMAFQPEVRAHWVHEFNPDLDPESYRMAGVDGGGRLVNVALQSREEDLIRLGAGLRFWNWESRSTEFGIDIDSVTGGEYQAFIFSGNLIHRF